MTRWRFVVLTTAGATKGWTIDSVERLRAAHAWALRAYAHHQIDDYQWWRTPPEPADKTCPRCSYEYAPGRARTELCQCGHPHAIYQCVRCGDRTDPPHSDGCSPIPHDPNGYRPPRPLRHRPR